MGTNNIKKDRIYKIRKTDNVVEGELLYHGDLNLHVNSPVETLNFYENKDIKKVYWIDNRNQPRILNSVDKNFDTWNDSSFNFIKPLKLKETVSISKNLLGNGVFPAGVIQYAFTYYNMYGQESNIFYTSTLFNLSLKNIAVSPENNVNCSFNIKISNLDTNFQYLRIYSIVRTSINSTPIVRQVADIKINKILSRLENRTINYVDNGTTGSIIDTTQLLYVGGEEIIAETFTQKDNTLFLGNIQLKRPTVGNIQIPKNSSDKTTDYSTIVDLLKQHNGEISGDKGLYSSGYIELQNKIFGEDSSSGIHYSYNPDSLHNTNSLGDTETFKTFKTNEIYRFGVQFQHVSGKWSEPLFVNDKKIDIKNLTVPDNEDITKVTYYGVKASMSLHDTNYKLIETLVQNNYIKARGVVVYPNAYERTVIAQGVVNPTLFSTDDRVNGTPHNFSSWFFRPMNDKQIHYLDRGVSLTAPGGGYSNPDDELSYTQTAGTIAEFRHLFALPSGRHSNLGINNNTQLYNYLSDTPNVGNTRHMGYVNQEVQSLYSSYLRDAFLTLTSDLNLNPHNTLGGTTSKTQFLKLYRDNIFIDQNLVTFHSPDIEFDESLKNISNENLECKIVGFVNLTGFIGKKYINTNGTPWNPKAQGNILSNVNQPNYSKQGGNILISYPLYRDAAIGDDDGPGRDFVNYMIYPWNRMDVPISGRYEAKDKAVLEYNKTSNLRYSAYNTYLNSPEPLLLNDGSNGITPVQIFNSEQIEIIKIKYKNKNINQSVYQGNVDKLVSTSDTISSSGYPIMGTNKNADSTISDVFGLPVQLVENNGKLTTSNHPVNIKFNSTPHLVFGLEYENTMEITERDDILIQNILPSLNNFNRQNDVEGKPFWDSEKLYRIQQQNINLREVNDNLFPTKRHGHSGLWLVELHRNENDIKNRFGDGVNGPTQESLENLNWVPCGEPVSLINSFEELGQGVTPKEEVTIEWTEGDTYLQRYDCLKTYGTEADKQSVTEILSFMCETRVNIDGRYDRNRGELNNTSMTPQKFNLINPIYTQKNNFFTYRSLNYDRFNLDNFPNTITWTKTKAAGELIDTWTNINLASTTDVDGNLGSIKALRNYNSTLIGFQDKGVFTVNFNSRVQIPSSDGVPIEISNNFKVDGCKYISTNIGTTNKWGINTESVNGLYFIDDISKAFYVLTDSFKNISDLVGFHSWFVSNIKSTDIWKSENSSNFILSYDKIHNHIYLTNKDTSLGFAESLNVFSSFYSYNNIPYMFNIWDNFISIGKSRDGDNNKFSLWDNYKGDYNNFYNKIEPFYITYVINPEYNLTKFFEILEFQADAYNQDGTVSTNPLFSKLTVWNEYQKGEAILLDNSNLPTSNLKGRFKNWRVNIPRAVNIDENSSEIKSLTKFKYNNNRMNSHSIFLKLESDGKVNKKNTLHSIDVYTRT